MLTITITVTLPPTKLAAVSSKQSIECHNFGSHPYKSCFKLAVTMTWILPRYWETLPWWIPSSFLTLRRIFVQLMASLTVKLYTFINILIVYFTLGKRYLSTRSFRTYKRSKYLVFHNWFFWLLRLRLYWVGEEGGLVIHSKLFKKWLPTPLPP